MLNLAAVLKNLLLQNVWADIPETWYVASGTVYSSDDPMMTLTYCMARSILAFTWKKVKTMDF